MSAGVVHLIFYLSEGALIRERCSFKPWRSLKKKWKVVISKTERLKNKKWKYDLLSLEIIKECVCKFPYFKKQRISDWRRLFSSFLQNIWMSASADIANFQMSSPFLIWGGPSFKLGRSLKFSAVNRGAHSKGTFIYVKALFQIITVRLLLERCKNLIFTMIARKMTGIRKKENLFGITYKFN